MVGLFSHRYYELSAIKHQILCGSTVHVRAISPDRDSEQYANWFYYVKDKILLAYVAAKAHLSHYILTQMLVFAS